mmetsp:Transcript_23033/g.78468  ORF Transcript_23033/g.78468 Transcript_23033/m.78468 type:complete len:108 (+) Transcript_23033:243-566(+)
MTWDFCLWAICFFLEGALLGVLMYTVRIATYFSFHKNSCCSLTLVTACTQLICLSDLEKDFVNPHDSSARINKCIVRRPNLIYVTAQSFQPTIVCAAHISIESLTTT